MVKALTGMAGVEGGGHPSTNGDQCPEEGPNRFHQERVWAAPEKELASGEMHTGQKSTRRSTQLRKAQRRPPIRDSTRTAGGGKRN